ncbi:MAG: CPBP family intramembrane glutamic endopeptidase [Vicinamibacterales bacterium]
MIPAPRLMPVVLTTQAGLAIAAVLGAQAAGLRFAWGRPLRDVVVGAVVAVALGAANLALLERPIGPWAAMRAAVDEVLIPTFAGLSRWQIVTVSAAAGIGEELFFRGFLQPLAGVVAAALAFGAAHVAGARLVAFGIWAAGMGLVLGGLATATGGIVAPITAHACYDVLAFNYLGAEGRRRDSARGRATGDA